MDGAYLAGAQNIPDMISIEELHPQFAADCRGLNVGESAYSRRAEIPYDIHRYPDGWHVYWKSPPNGRIGRRLWLRSQLDAFLGGKLNRETQVPV